MQTSRRQALISLGATATMLIAASALASGSGSSGSGNEVMATNKPIAGVGAHCSKRPRGNTKRERLQITASDGGIAYSGLEPGVYELTIPGRTGISFFRVSADGNLSARAVEAVGVTNGSVRFLSTTNAVVFEKDALSVPAKTTRAKTK